MPPGSRLQGLGCILHTDDHLIYIQGHPKIIIPLSRSYCYQGHRHRSHEPHAAQDFKAKVPLESHTASVRCPLEHPRGTAILPANPGASPARHPLLPTQLLHRKRGHLHQKQMLMDWITLATFVELCGSSLLPGSEFVNIRSHIVRISQCLVEKSFWSWYASRMSLTRWSSLLNDFD